MSDLNIQVAENGFVINEGGAERHCVGKQWAFESADSLAEFIKQWGNDVHKPIEILPVLEKGKALIITGGKGVGKTTTAIKIANKHGTHILTSLQEIRQGDFALSQVLEDEPDTVIIEDILNEFNKHGQSLDQMKPLITDETINIERKGKSSKFVKLPNFIICTGSKEALKLGANERRFTILPL